ncbi:MAG: (d)CMP kinase [Actinomycetota bacterium]
MIVAIDGPAGAGKSSIARGAARRLGFGYLDTGAMYRAAAVAILDRGVAPDAADEVARVVEGIALDVNGDRVVIDGSDVSQRIRSAAVTAIVSTISAQPRVRANMAARQRALAAARDVVIEGRDIGTVIAPDAAVKVFLTASIDERARRRCSQLGLSENGEEYDRIRSEIAARDAADSSRAESPLQAAPDAVTIDTTDMSEAEAIDAVVDLVEQRRAR